jgi:threonine aldolase
MELIDLRSDTVTQPTQPMRDAMAHAEVGDDVYGEDPTVNRLQELAAEVTGKEAALFVPTGTMANIASILAHCQRGDEVILGNLAHPYLNESGGIAALGGIQPFTIPNQDDGTLLISDIENSIREDDPHHPITRLIALENTHNRCNGAFLELEYIESVGKIAHKNNLAFHIDGARIFNASVASGVKVKKLVAMADSVTFCLSKGLCAPVGSLICGSKEFIAKTLRLRKQLGGGMRQAGIIAAAGIIAIEQMTLRLAKDHERAKRLSLGLSGIKALSVSPQHTNIVRFTLLPESGKSPEEFKKALVKRGIRIGHAGSWGFRAVTHHDISDDSIDKTLSAFSDILE